MASGALRSLNVLGLNSGTSMDGIDVALFRIGPGTGSSAGPDASFDNAPALEAELLASDLISFEDNFKRNLERVVASRQSDLKTLCLLNSALGQVFGEAALKVVKQARAKGLTVDLIGSHGQTIWHEPKSSNLWGVDTAGTLQLGDPAYVAAITGVTTVGDFRTYDVAHGGQGAPLVSFADEVMFGHDKGAVGVLNLGGIANITVVKDGRSVMAFDTGPANVLIDEAMRILYDSDYDAGGAVASSGRVHDRLLDDLMKNPYFAERPPKTTGRELFGRDTAAALVEQWQAGDVEGEDIIATLTAFTARSVAHAVRDFVFPIAPLDTVVLGGGGAYNETLKKMMRDYWPGPLHYKSHEDYGVSAKFKEALLFALLAYTTYFDIPNNVPVCTGAARRVCLGKLVRA